MLLIASYVFYGFWDWRFLFLIVFSSVLDFLCGIFIYESKGIKNRRFYLYLSIAGNLSVLGFFKYCNFFSEGFQKLFSIFSITIDPFYLNIVLPVGISFYTFQTMSYTIDIYRKEMKPTRQFFDFALFVAFFPQLVAGPIERAKRLLPQILKYRIVDFDCFSQGLRLILWGFFKKVVVADSLAIVVDNVYGTFYRQHGFTLMLATFFFSFQIYCDFSGYSDIARGLARLMGFNIMNNFRIPYFSSNLTDFWHRWHISLSTWLRDYVYIPLGGNRSGKLNTYKNLLITMLLGGLWHGANWTFVVWGALHGFCLIVCKIFSEWFPNNSNKKFREAKFGKIVKSLLTFSFVTIAWVFFRSSSMQDALYVLKTIFSIDFNFSAENLSYIVANKVFILRGIAGIIFLLIIEAIPRHDKDREFLWFDSIIARWTVYYAVIFYLLLFGVYNGNSFIYFQF
jgi:D-alanyl-lipoteichoic acid acyltransferase DltB (MBOAT superfamily)